MIIRLVFEPEKNVNVNHDKMFEFYSQNYLSDFDTVWGGSIMIDNFSKKHYKQEPCYQRYVPSVRGTQELFDKIVKYIKSNPLAGYTTHIYSNPEGGNEVELEPIQKRGQ
jgi:ribosomal protein S17E|tara:strand:+ start:746 stop:1075 length:330 start_codon:yes stop_codon:yes gene_type:complete